MPRPKKIECLLSYKSGYPCLGSEPQDFVEVPIDISEIPVGPPPDTTVLNVRLRKLRNEVKEVRDKVVTILFYLENHGLMKDN